MILLAGLAAAGTVYAIYRLCKRLHALWRLVDDVARF